MKDILNQLSRNLLKYLKLLLLCIQVPCNLLACISIVIISVAYLIRGNILRGVLGIGIMILASLLYIYIHKKSKVNNITTVADAKEYFADVAGYSRLKFLCIYIITAILLVSCLTFTYAYNRPSNEECSRAITKLGIDDQVNVAIYAIPGYTLDFIISSVNCLIDDNGEVATVANLEDIAHAQKAADDLVPFVYINAFMWILFGYSYTRYTRCFQYHMLVLKIKRSVSACN